MKKTMKPMNKAIVILILSLVLCLTSCRSSRTTTVEKRSEARTETTVRETRTTDSEYIHDSIYVREGGDTVYMTRWRTCWRDRFVHDTVFEHITDTIHETKTEQTVVEVPTKGSNAGWIVAITLFLLILVYILIKCFLR